MGVKRHHIHKASIKNNCPNCFSAEGLKLDFYQEETENPIFKKASSTIHSTLYCSKCETRIFPVNWDQDIERVEEYHRKLAQKLNSNYRLKPLGYAIPAIVITLILLAAYLFV